MELTPQAAKVLKALDKKAQEGSALKKALGFDPHEALLELQNADPPLIRRSVVKYAWLITDAGRRVVEEVKGKPKERS